MKIIVLFSLRLSCIQPGNNWQQYATRGGEIFVHLTGMVSPWAGNLMADFLKMSMSMSRFYWFLLFCTGNSFVQVYKAVHTMWHWKLGSFSPCFMTPEFKPAEFHATCCGDKILSPQQHFFAGMLHEENCGCSMSLQHAPATCPRNMSPSVCRPLETILR